MTTRVRMGYVGSTATAVVGKPAKAEDDGFGHHHR